MNTCCNLHFYLRASISDCRSEIKITGAIVDKDDSKLSQRRVMTVVIEFEPRLQSVVQVDRRTHNSWRSLLNEWRLMKIEVHKAEEEESF